jgi:putative transposase
VSRFRFVADHIEAYPVKRLCHAVGVSRSGFYAWRTRRPSARAVQDHQLLAEIRTIRRDSRRTYGAPRVHGQLRRNGHRGGPQTRRQADAPTTGWSARTAAADRVVAVVVSRRRPTGSTGTSALIGQINGGSLTSASSRPARAKLYIAGIRDLCHGGLVGWAMDEHPDAMSTTAGQHNPRPSRQASGHGSCP